MTDKELQYVELQRSPSGYMGAARLVEYVEGEPYIRVQRPPGAAGTEATLDSAGGR